MRVISFGIFLSMYVVGLERLWQAGGRGGGIRRIQALAFLTGWLAIAFALSAPMDEWSNRWLAAHLAKHELLMVVAAPLIAASRPLFALLWSLPTRYRRTTLRRVLTLPVVRAWSAATTPLAVIVVHAAALGLWRFPSLYGASFFGAATMFWWGILHGRYGRRASAAAVLYVVVTAIHGGALGVLMTFPPHGWYASFLAPYSGPLALAGEQLPGLVMWVPAAFAAGAAFLFFGARLPDVGQPPFGTVTPFRRPGRG